MPSRLHEGMTRTRSPRGKASPRAAYLTLAAAALLLALGWAVVSLTGAPETREAQAQTSGPEDPGPGGGSDNELEEPSYESFGERRDPFALVVEEAAEGEDMNGGEEDPEGADQDTTGEDDEEGATPPDDQTESPDDGASTDDSEQNQGSDGEGGSGAPGGSGAVQEDVDCEDPADQFEQVLCEERESGSAADDPGAAQPVPDDRDGDSPAADDGDAAKAGSDDDGFGGAGRSGAGEPTESFRNGGAATGK